MAELVTIRQTRLNDIAFLGTSRDISTGAAEHRDWPPDEERGELGSYCDIAVFSTSLSQVQCIFLCASILVPGLRCLVSSTCNSSHNAWVKPQGTLRTRTVSRVSYHIVCYPAWLARRLTASIVPRRQFVPRCTNFLGSILRFCLLATMLVACAGTARNNSTCN